MSTALVQDTRVENTAARTATTSTFANPDGTWTTEAYVGVVRSKVDQDKWADVDASVETVGNGFEPVAVPFDARFSDGQDRALATVTSPEGAKLALKWPTDLPTATADGGEVRFPDAAPGGGTPADLVVTSRSDGFNFSVELDEAPTADAAQLVYRVPLSISDGRFITNDDGSLVVESKGDTIATMSQPVMWDSTKDDTSPAADRVPVTTSFEGTGEAVTLVLKPDMDWLRDADRTYPVVVDPTVALTATGDTWVNSLEILTNHDTSTELQVGSNNLGLSRSRSYLNFDVSSIPTGATISSAAVTLSNFETGSCTGSAIRMSRVTSAWTPTGLQWGNQPTTTSTGSTTTTDSYGATGCATETPVAFDAKPIVDAWRSGQANQGVMISADVDNAATGWRKYRSLESGTSTKVPTLSVTYNGTPDVPTGNGVSPAGSVGTMLESNDTTPTFTTTPSDPDGGNVTAELRIRQGSTVVQSWTSGSVLSGTQVSRTITTALAAGSYTASWRTSDGNLTSAWSADQAFNIDLTAPTAPSMACPNYASGSWQTTRPASSTTCTITVSADTQWVQVNDGHEWTTLTPPANNQTSMPLDVPVDSAFSFSVVAADAATNTSAATTYNFGVGDGGFYTPMPGATFAGQLQVDAGAQSGATSAALKWREAGTTAWATATHITKAGSAWSGSVDATGAIARTGGLLWDADAETGLAPPSNRHRGLLHLPDGADRAVRKGPRRYPRRACLRWHVPHREHRPRQSRAADR